MVTISSSAVGTAAASAAYALVAWVWSAVTYEYSLLENGRHLAHVLLAVTLLAVTVGAALATSSSGNERCVQTREITWIDLKTRPCIIPLEENIDSGRDVES